MRRSLRCTLLAAALAWTGEMTAAAQSDPADAFPAVSNNAALQYWQAFALLPALDDAQEKLLDDRATVPLDAAALQLIDKSQASLMYLHRGAKLRECDWGLDYGDGVNMYLPHLVRARTLGRLAALDVRRACEAEQYDRARDDAFGMVALARQVGGDRTMVSMLVCYMIEEMTVDAVAPYLPELGVSSDDAEHMFELLPPSPPLSQGVLCEHQMIAWLLQKMKDKERQSPGSWRPTWKTILGKETPNPLGDMDDLGQVVEMIEQLQTYYDELGKLTRLPAEQFDAKYPEFASRAKADNPLAKLVLPAMDKIVAAQRRSQARTAMLLAGIAVVEGGPEKLDGIKDPFGDGPFGYRKLEKGFELSSKLQQDGKPVTLAIGQKPPGSGS